MKKKLVLAVAMGLIVALNACVGGSVSEQQGGLEQMQETVSETPACEHNWQEATYKQPKTCTVCGETEGEALADYFKMKGVSVQQTFPRVKQPLQYVTYLYNNTDIQVAHTDGTFAIETMTEAGEEGFNIVTVIITHQMPIFSDDSTDGDFGLVFSDAFFDLYSGEVIIREEELLTGNAPIENKYAFIRSIPSNGTDMEIQLNAREEWYDTGWFLNDQDAEEDDYTCIRTYEFLLPAGYDGLVYASLPMSEYVAAEVQPAGTKAADITGEENLKKATLIRVAP